MIKEGNPGGDKTEFKPTMDPHALDIERGGRIIGSLQWHEGRIPKVVLSTKGDILLDLPIEVLEDIVAKSHEVSSPKK